MHRLGDYDSILPSLQKCTGDRPVCRACVNINKESQCIYDEASSSAPNAIIGWRYNELSYGADGSSSPPDEGEHFLNTIQLKLIYTFPGVGGQISSQSNRESDPAGNSSSDFASVDDLFPSDLSIPDAGQDNFPVSDFSFDVASGDTLPLNAFWTSDVLSDMFTAGNQYGTDSGALQTVDLPTHLCVLYQPRTIFRILSLTAF